MKSLIDLIETVPTKYNAQTTLKVEILGGQKTVFRFELTSE